MPPAGNRVLGGGDEGQQHVPADVFLPHLPGPDDLKSRIAVMQQRHVVGAQGQRHRPHRLMPRRSDGVKPLPRPLHDAGNPVQRPAETGTAKNRHRLRRGQRAGGGRAHREIPRENPAAKIVVNDVGAVHLLLFPGS